MADHSSDDLARFGRRLLLVVLTLAFVFVLYRWLHVLLLAFGAVLVAVLLRAVAEPIARRTPLKGAGALAAAVVLILALLGAIGAFIGSQIADQLVQLWQALPGAWQAAQQRIGQLPGGAAALQHVHQLTSGAQGQFGSIAGEVAKYTKLGLSSLAEAFVMVVAGVYFAAQPGLYRGGLLALFPPSSRQRAEGIGDEIGLSLRKWLLGTGIAMLAMGAITAGGTALLGLPTPLALGLLSGLAEFVPIVGAVVSAVPGVILGAVKSPHVALLTVLFYIAAHQFEGQVLIPLIQRKVVEVPPALTLFAVLGFGILFGPLGIALATPLAVVALVIGKALTRPQPAAEGDEAKTATEPVGARGEI